MLLCRQNESQMFETAERGARSRQPREARQILVTTKVGGGRTDVIGPGTNFLERGLWREDQISRSGNIVQNNQTLPLIPVQHSTNFYQSFDFLQKKTKITRDFTVTG